MTPRPWLPVAAVGVTLVLWASAFVGIRHLAPVFDPGALSLGRLLVGSLALGLYVAWQRAWVRPTRAQWWSMIAIGVLWFGIYNLALNKGEHLVDAGTASMILQISPVLIAVGAALFLSEAFTWPLAVGLGMALAGVALISFGAGNARHHDVLGVLLCLLAALVYSISLLLQKPVVAAISASQLTWVACCVGALVCLPWAGHLVAQAQAASSSEVAWLVYLGLFPTAVAFTTYAYALGHMPASQLGVTTYLVPPITVVLSWVLLSETPPMLAYVGGALTLIGVAVARRKPARGVSRRA